MRPMKNEVSGCANRQPSTALHKANQKAGPQAAIRLQFAEGLIPNLVL